MTADHEAPDAGKAESAEDVKSAQAGTSDGDTATADAAEGAPGAEGAQQGAGEAPEDDVKRRFREALERKRRGGAGGGARGVGPDTSKVHGAQADHAARREFRRKSG